MLRCLAYFLVPKSRKKKVIEDSSDIPHVVMEGNVSKKIEIMVACNKGLRLV